MEYEPASRELLPLVLFVGRIAQLRSFGSCGPQDDKSDSCVFLGHGGRPHGMLRPTLLGLGEAALEGEED